MKQIAEDNFFNLYFGNSDSDFKGFDVENKVSFWYELNDYLCNDMKMFDCTWTKVY